MTPLEVRSELVAALQLDLVGPQNGGGSPQEILPHLPSRWYLTGFLVPFDAGESQASDVDAGDEIDGAGEPGGTDDDVSPEIAAASKTRFPSSMGLSVLLPVETTQLQVTVDWGDYAPAEAVAGHPYPWQRQPRQQTLTVPIDQKDRWRKDIEIPGSNGMKISLTGRSVTGALNSEAYSRPCQSVSVFLVNHRPTRREIPRSRFRPS